MGFKSDITAFQKVLHDYDERGKRMRAGRWGDVWQKSYWDDEPAEKPRVRESTYMPEGEWEYSCQYLGCDGMTCGHP